MAGANREVYKRLRSALDEHIKRCADVPYRPAGGVAPGEQGPAYKRKGR